MAEKTPMYLIGMKVTNFLKIENFDYQFDGKSVKIAGPNASGKTTLLRAVWAAVLGKAQVPVDVINKGKEKGEIEANLGGMVVKRTFTEKDSYLTVTLPAGPGGIIMKASNPQKILDSLVGEIALDPHAFMETDAKRQAEMAGHIFGVSDRLAEIDAKIKTFFEERTYTNRRCKELEAELKGTKPEPVVEEPVDIAALEIASQKYADLDLEYRSEKMKLDQSVADINKAKVLVSDYEKQISEIKEKISRQFSDIAKLGEISDTSAKRMTDIEVEAKAMPKREDLKTQIQEGRELNDRIKQTALKVEAWDKKAADLDEVEEKSTELSATIESLRKQRQQTIASAEIPVDGLGFEDGAMTYNEHPLSNASHAEQLRVAIAILMCQDPTLKLLTIKDASLMDAASWKVVEELASEHKFQVLYEIVSDDPDSAGLYIEDGNVTHVDGKKVEKKVEIINENAQVSVEVFDSLGEKPKAKPKTAAKKPVKTAPRSQKELDALAADADREMGDERGLFE